MKEIKNEEKDLELKSKSEIRKLKIIICLSIILIMSIMKAPIQYLTAVITIIGIFMTLTFFMPISNIKKNGKQVILIILSILMFASLFTCSYKISGIYFLIWTVYIFYSIGILAPIKRNIIMPMFFKQTEKDIESAYDKNENGKFLLYSAVVPAVSMGLIVLVILIFSMIFLL